MNSDKKRRKKDEEILLIDEDSEDDIEIVSDKARIYICVQCMCSA